VLSTGSAQIKPTNDNLDQPADSLGKSAIADTTTLPLHIPIVQIKSMGSIKEQPDFSVHGSTFPFTAYKYAGSFLEFFPGIFIYSLGSPGTADLITSGGFSQVTFLNDGVPLNEPLNGGYNLYLYPTETIEKFEFINSANSYYYGINSNSSVINFESKNFKSLKPFSRIRYSESGYEETFLDGFFSQNFLSNLNFNGGIQRAAYDGRYLNSAYDSWMAHTKIRYDVSNKVNLFFSEIYNQNETGLNGGVDIINTSPAYYFEPLQATVRNQKAYEKTARNDLQLTAAVRALPDSTSLSKLSFNLSNNVRRYRNDGHRMSFYSRWMGIKFNQHLDFIRIDSLRKLFNLDFGIDVQSRQIFEGLPAGYRANTIISVFGKTEYRPLRNLNITGYLKNDTYLKKHYLNLGFDANYSVINNMMLYGGYSESYRYPTFQENYWRDTTIRGEITNYNPEKHKLFEIGISFSLGRKINIRSKYFNRNINEAIVPVSVNSDDPTSTFIFKNDDINVSGIDATGEVTIWKVTGIFNSTVFLRKSSNASSLPKTWVAGEIFFRDTFFKNNLDLKFGIRGKAISKQSGYQFNPRTITYLPSTNFELGAGGSFDAFVLGKIGSAIVHIVLENVLDNQYAITTFYPVQDRSLRFGITWEFEN
jgi:hypothetical protein